MSKLATEHKAINLGQGFPGFPMDMKLAELVQKYMVRGHNQYAPMQGVLELRQVLSKKILSSYGHEYNADTEITVTSGGTQAIFTAITALVHEDDEVIMFAPAYDCYAPAVELNGGKPVWVNLDYPDYKINWEGVKKLVNHRTRLIIINSPHNPSGTCMSESDMRELVKIVSGTDIFVLSDEVYEHMVYDGKQHQSVSRFPELAKQSFVVFSFGKTFHNTGWKMGYICGPQEMMTEYRKVHQYNVFSCNTPIQYALAEYMEDTDKYLSLPDFYQRKRDCFIKSVSGSRFQIVPASGTYFQLLGYESMFKEKDTDLAMRLTREFGIASIPCSVFYPEATDQNVLRFCFAKDEESLNEAGNILRMI